MNAGIAAYRSKRGESQLRAMHLMTLLFAREANVEPDLREWPQLARELLFGPLSAISFRLSRPDRLLDAGERISTEARALGTVGTFADIFPLVHSVQPVPSEPVIQVASWVRRAYVQAAIPVSTQNNELSLFRRLKGM